MSQLRFLKRLNQWQASDKTQVVASSFETELLRDIENLLNTNEGNALIDPTMGLSDLKEQFQNHGAPDIEGLEKQVLMQINQFESRITSVNLTFNDDNRDPTCFSWKLSAVLVNALDGQAISANIKLQANGQVMIESVE